MLLLASHARHVVPFRLGSLRLARCLQPHSPLIPSSPVSHQHASSARKKSHGLVESGPDLNDEPYVNPDSLEATLEAHRAANRVELAPIRKFDQDRKYYKLNVTPPFASHASVAPAPVSQGPTYAAVKHLNLRREGREGGGEGRKRKQQQDYQGRKRGLTAEWNPPPSLVRRLRYPWAIELDRLGEETYTKGADVRLSEEIRACDRYLSPNESEKAAGEAAVLDISELVRSTAGLTRVDLIGSRVTGLAGPLSDIDLNIPVLPGADGTVPAPADSVDFLRSLYKQMRDHQNSAASAPAKVTAFIGKARVPIITGVHTPSGLEFQIQHTTSAYGSMEYTKGVLVEARTLRSLFRIVKQSLHMHGLAEGSRGGLTSYPLLNMIAAALEVGGLEVGSDDVGKQLLHILKFYAEIDFYNTAITTSPESASRKTISTTSTSSSVGNNPTEEELPDILRGSIDEPVPAQYHLARRPAKHGPKYLMSLQDPTNPFNDLGKSVFLIKHIQATFLSMKEQLQRAMKSWDAEDGVSRRQHKSRPPLLACIVQGDYRLLEQERADLRQSVDSRSEE